MAGAETSCLALAAQTNEGKRIDVTGSDVWPSKHSRVALSVTCLIPVSANEVQEFISIREVLFDWSDLRNRSTNRFGPTECRRREPAYTLSSK